MKFQRKQIIQSETSDAADEAYNFQELLQHEKYGVRIQALSKLKSAFNRFTVKKKEMTANDIMLLKGLYANVPANDDETASDEDLKLKRTQ